MRRYAHDYVLDALLIRCCSIPIIYIVRYHNMLQGKHVHLLTVYSYSGHFGFLTLTQHIALVDTCWLYTTPVLSASPQRQTYDEFSMISP